MQAYQEPEPASIKLANNPGWLLYPRTVRLRTFIRPKTLLLPEQSCLLLNVSSGGKGRYTYSKYGKYPATPQ